MENNVITPYKLRPEDRAAHIWVDNGDKLILKSNKSLLKTSITGANHFLLGTAARCFEEKHLQTITDL